MTRQKAESGKLPELVVKSIRACKNDSPVMDRSCKNFRERKLMS